MIEKKTGRRQELLFDTEKPHNRLHVDLGYVDGCYLVLVVSPGRIIRKVNPHALLCCLLENVYILFLLHNSNTISTITSELSEIS